MRILRNIVVGSVFGGSALAIAFACVDRLDHPAPKASRSAAPVAALTRARPPEPTVTGSLPAETGPSISDILGRDGGGTTARTPVVRTTPPKPATAREAAAKVTPKPAAPKPPVKRTAEGFDTERLNALMRGDPAVTLTRAR
ncbi:hypothetical protein MKK58_16640 [Methylobacterium sp. J-078]|uniref:hypothetical protein n=1 Tax=Methylobacterium sp. J-078 TaxID=2836657 RepID=UPI001FB9EC21|nr:hypothetical protein [Methylobacterium sp. J-078]MCJ2046144.1 hypothetical protein [Methylobacterium sp. J-078]